MPLSRTFADLVVEPATEANPYKLQHPRQIEFIILSIFASSGSMAGLVSSMGRPTPSEESAVPDELVPGAAAVVPKAPHMGRIRWRDFLRNGWPIMHRRIVPGGTVGVTGIAVAHRAVGV